LSDENYLRGKYPDLLGQDADPGQVRLIRDLETLSSADQPPEQVLASIRRTLLREVRSRAIRNRDAGEYDRGSDGRTSGDWRGIVADRKNARTLWASNRATRAAGLGAFAVVVVAIVLGLSVMLSRMDRGTADVARGGDSAAGALQQAGTAIPEDEPASPLLSGTGVLHIEGTRSWRTERGEVRKRLAVEFWYDRATGNARLHLKTLLSDPGYDWVTLREGRRYALYNPVSGWRDVEVSTPDSPVPATPRPVDEMFRLGSFLPGWERLIPAGEEQVGGRRAIALARRDTGERVLYIDRESRLPLRREVAWSEGGRTYRGVETFEYPVIETVDKGSLPPGLFSVDAILSAPHAPTAEPTLPAPTPETGGVRPVEPAGTPLVPVGQP
jgi:hypothetical protein